jgi:hypothetical protein
MLWASASLVEGALNGNANSGAGLGLAAAGMATTLSIASLAVGVAGVVLGIGGMRDVYRGKDAFGPEHGLSVKRAAMLAIAAATAYGAYAALNLGPWLSSGVGNLPAPSAGIAAGQTRALASAMGVSSLVGLLATLLAAFSMTGFVHKLVPAELDWPGTTFLALSFLAAFLDVAAGAMTYTVLGDLSLDGAPLDLLTAVTWIAGLSMAVSVVAILALRYYLQLLRRARDEARRRLDDDAPGAPAAVMPARARDNEGREAQGSSPLRP